MKSLYILFSLVTLSLTSADPTPTLVPEENCTVVNEIVVEDLDDNFIKFNYAHGIFDIAFSFSSFCMLVWTVKHLKARDDFDRVPRENKMSASAPDLNV